MILISKIIATFIKAIKALLNVSDEYLEDSQTIVNSIGSFTSSDKMIRPMPFVAHYMIPSGNFFAIGNKFCVADFWKSNVLNSKLYTSSNLNTWSNVAIENIGLSSRVLPVGSNPHFGYNQIPPVTQGGIIQGVTANSLAISSAVGATINTQKASYTYHSGSLASFLYNERRIILANQFSCVLNQLNDANSLLSPGWFIIPGMQYAYQGYSPIERELIHRRIELPHPLKGLTVLNKTYPDNITMPFVTTSIAMTEDSEGNIYSLHSINFVTSEFEPKVTSNNMLILCKNFIPVNCSLVNSLDGRTARETTTNLMVGENGDASARMAFKDNLFISQYNKIYEINKTNFVLENIYETPFCISQLSANANYLYAVHQGGVSVCNPQ
jgi:hypothetical protein